MPTRTIIINRKATSKKAAVVKDTANARPIELRDFLFGDIEVIRLQIADGDGAIDSISGDSSYSVKAALGVPNANPTAGTFTLTFGADTTAALAYNATAAQVQTALEALASIGSGNCRVTGTTGAYQVEFIGTLANVNQALMTGSAALLTPQSSVTISEAQAGGGGNNEKQVVRLVRLPVAVQSTWTAYPTAGQQYWEGTFQLNTFRALEELNGLTINDSMVFEVQLTDGSGNKETVCSQAAVLRAEVIDESSLVPVTITVVTSDGYTLDQLKQIFVQYTGNASGRTVLLRSANGTYYRELGVNNDGSGMDNIT